MTEHSDIDPQYWLASIPSVPESKLPGYLSDGEWSSSNSGRDADLLASMAPGDLIALKSVATRKTGLPFFNADQGVSVMTVYATGTVLSADTESGRVKVQWNPLKPSREWYLFTYIPPLARVADDGGGMRTHLIRFCFEDADQSLDFFLREDFWADRYPPQPAFSWIPFYEEFATRLLSYRDNRSELIRLLLDVAASQPLLNYLVQDRDASGAPTEITDIDPFTFIGAFNRGLTTDNRRAIARALAEALEVTAPLPTDFDGVPILNNQNSWFIRFSTERSSGDIEALWRVFAAAIDTAADNTPASLERFAAAYDSAQQVSGVRWNLSQGIYWARPNHYVTIETLSRNYLKRRFDLSAPADGLAYLALRDSLLETMQSGSTSLTSFPLLSYAAWWSATAAPVPHSVEGMAVWGSRLAESIDLHEIEHDYKRKTAAILARARTQASAQDATWVQTFQKGMASTNTLDFRFKDDLNQAVIDDPARLLTVFRVLWDNPEPRSLDTFQEALGDALGHVTPGNVTGLSAALLMAVDPENNAPFGTRRVARWFKLTDFPGNAKGLSASSRYTDMLAFLDALAEQIAHHTGTTPTRLETQGFAWATTENEIPQDWAPHARKALQAWRGTVSDSTRRAWLVRPKTTPTSTWIGEDFISLAATHLGDVPADSTKKEIEAAVESGYGHQDYSQRTALTTECVAFLSTMAIGDIVAVQADTVLYLGTVVGVPTYVEDDGDRLRREVSWSSRVSTDDSPSVLSGLLDVQGTVVDITDGIETLTLLLENGDQISLLPPTEGDNEDEVVAISESPSDSVPALPPVTADLAARLFMDRASLQEILDVLGSRQQLVLYGPPGTGKTFLAMKLARHIVGPADRSRAQLVQFHPSYAYEDFFEGYRPTESDQGQATFKLMPGPLRRIVAEARENLDKPYVLVIDELNRANIAKVFGELYFLLEYRDESIQLQYQPSEAFRLPRNLFFIATMNTADRSIALLDAAMRRRFSFVELHPDEPPVRDVLSSWLTKNHHDDDRAKLLATLNAAIEDQDRDLRIGPSYLMRPEAATENGLARVWKYDIMPLLEEHYYGRLSRQQIQERFGLTALREGLVEMSEDLANRGVTDVDYGAIFEVPAQTNGD